MIDWLLVDYGEVLSTPLPDTTIETLARTAGMEPATLLERYWAERRDYDLGLSPELYWSRVLQRDPADLGRLTTTLTQIDVHGWLQLNSLTLRTLLLHARRDNLRLALLSNAPEPLAAAIDRCYWARNFTHRLYSCRLHQAKPDPAAFTAALTRLDSDPRRVLFIDDRTENTRTANALELATITFTSASSLARELKLLRLAQTSARSA